jgi:hypothetical protein
MRSEKIRCRKLWETITDDGSQSKTHREREREREREVFCFPEEGGVGFQKADRPS